MTLRVKLEIVPHGDEDKAYEIGRLDIFNTGEKTPTGHHVYGVIDLTSKQEGQYKEEIFHRRSNGAWELVRHVLTRVGPEPSPLPKKHIVLATQGQGMAVAAAFNNLEESLAYVENHQSEASFAIQYPDGSMHAWDKPRPE